MESVIFISIISFFVTFSVIPIVIKISEAKNFFDIPSDRKIHKYPIPSLGGVGIFIALIFSISIVVPFSTAPWMQYFIAAATIIFFLGMKDDILLLSPIKKFMGQLIATFLLVYQGHFQLTSFHGFLGIDTLPTVLSLVFTYLTILVIINAFNLIDGVNGLAGTLGLISSLFFGIVFLMEKDFAFAAVSFSLASSLVAFLIFNISPAKIFMGDTGSLLLGLVNAILAIRFINLETSGTTVLHFSAAPALGFAVLFIPLIDTIRVSLIRIYAGKSPFEPDKNHIHHILLKRGYSHLKTTLVLASASLLLILFAIVCQPLGINFVIFSMFIISFSVIGLFQWLSLKAKKSSIKLLQSIQDSETLSVKVVTTLGGIKDLELNNPQ